MARMIGSRALLPMAAALLGAGAGTAWGGAQAASLGTTENTLFLPVWLGPGPESEPTAAPALLNMPPGWVAGDAAVVIAPGGDWPPGLRDRLVAALLDAGAAVLEMNEIRPARPAAAALREDMASALLTARDAVGAGLVVAVGRGAGGDAALEAGEVATSRGVGHYAAAARLGPGEPRFRMGPVALEEAWPARAPMLCDLLTLAQPGGEPDVGVPCRAALAVLR